MGVDLARPQAVGADSKAVDRLFDVQWRPPLKEDALMEVYSVN